MGLQFVEDGPVAAKYVSTMQPNVVMISMTNDFHVD